MKIRVEYEYDKQSSRELPFWAKSEVNGRLIYTCGASWDDVKARHIPKLKDLTEEKPATPQPEEVEI